MEKAASQSNKNQLQDGFQEMFTFAHHRLQLRGFQLVEWSDDSRRQSTDYSIKSQYYISWDVKQVLLWKYDFHDNITKPQLLHQMKFSNQPNYICAIVHVTKMKVFLAAALDMSFKIFDKQINLLESIKHEERAILQLEYDVHRDLIFSSGATGIAAWRLYRNISLDKAHVMEKLYTFAGCDSWVSHMIYEPQYLRIYAIQEGAVLVLSITRRAVVAVLDQIHDAPVTSVCWYDRNQFYITGCAQGEIKCWTSNFNRHKNTTTTHTINTTHNSNNNNNNNNVSAGDESIQEDDTSQTTKATNTSTSATASTKMFALLHKFKGHSKGVTSIKLHPVSGLAISTGLDGVVKVLNLEALNELFFIQVDHGILQMRLVKLGPTSHACLFSLTDASVKLWRITSVCDFFAVSSARIASLKVFETLDTPRSNRAAVINPMANKKAKLAKTVLTLTNQMKKQKEKEDTFGEYQLASLLGNRIAMCLEEDDATGGLPTTTMQGVQDTDNDDDDDEGDGDDSGESAAGSEVDIDNSDVEETGEQSTQKRHHHQHHPNRNSNDMIPKKVIPEKILVAYSTQDLRAYNQYGVVLGRLEPEHVVDGIKTFCISVPEKLLICLLEGDIIRVHDIQSFNFPLLMEFSLRGSVGGSSNNTSNNTSNISNSSNTKTKAMDQMMKSNGLKAESTNKQHQQQQQQTGTTIPGMNTNMAEDIGSCCMLIDIAPKKNMFNSNTNNRNTNTNEMNGSSSAPLFSPSLDEEDDGVGQQPNTTTTTPLLHTRIKSNIRGEKIADQQSECYLLIGLRTGAILFLDMFASFELQLNVQVLPGIVQEMVYRKEQKELMIIGTDYAKINTTLKLYTLPDMECILEMHDLYHTSCFAVSKNLNYFAFGCTNGSTRLFSFRYPSNVSLDNTSVMSSSSRPLTSTLSLIAQSQQLIQEVMHSSETHEKKILSLCFCDELKMYVTSSQDGKIYFWTLQKLLIRRISLLHTSCDIVMNGEIGNVVMAQGNYLLTVPKRIWNEGELLDNLYENADVLYALQDQLNDREEERAATLAAAAASANTATHQQTENGSVKRTDKTDLTVQTSELKKSVVGKSVTTPRLSKASSSGNSSSKHITPQPSHGVLSGSAAVGAVSQDDNDSDTSSTTGGSSSKREDATTTALNNMANRLIDHRRSTRTSIRHRSYHLGTAGGLTASSDDSTSSKSIELGTTPSSLTIGSTSELSKADRRKSVAMKKRLSISQKGSSVNGGPGSSNGIGGVLTLLGGKKDDTKMQMTTAEDDLFVSEILLPRLQQRQYEYCSNQYSMTTTNTSSMDGPTVAQPQPQLDWTIGSIPTATMMTNTISPRPPTSHTSHTNTTTFDVLHPKYLIHKKPPARLMNMDTVQACFEQYKSHVHKHFQTKDLLEGKELLRSEEYDRSSMDRRLAFMSPRARLTMLNTKPVATTETMTMNTNTNNMNANTNIRNSIGGKGEVMMEARKSNTVSTPFAVAAAGLSPTNAATAATTATASEEANWDSKAQERLILHFALGMKVSSQYQKSRMHLKQTRDERFQHLIQRATVVVSPTKARNTVLAGSGGGGGEAMTGVSVDGGGMSGGEQELSPSGLFDTPKRNMNRREALPLSLLANRQRSVSSTSEDSPGQSNNNNNNEEVLSHHHHQASRPVSPDHSIESTSNGVGGNSSSNSNTARRKPLRPQFVEAK